VNSTSRSRARVRKPRTSLRDEAKSLYRNAILHAAEEVFAERGFFSARIQDIAERGGFAVGTVYKHFEQKEDVLRALLIERVASMELALAAREGDPTGWEEKLITRLARLYSYVEEHRGFYRIALENGLFGVTSTSAVPLDEKDRAKIAVFKTRMHSLIAEGIQEQILSDVEPGLLASFLFSSVRAFTLGAFELGDSPEAKAAMIVDLFLRGAKKRDGVLPAAKSSEVLVGKKSGSSQKGRRERQGRK
jgi:TetR/AcrR family transcriptional regulator